MRTYLNRVRVLGARFGGDLLYAVASLVTSAVTFQGTIIAARHLNPVSFGVMQTLLLIPTYCAFLPLGVFNGLNRNIAFYLGRDNGCKVQAMVNSSWTVAKFVAAVGAFISFGFIVYYLHSGYSSLYIAGMVFVLLALVLEPFSQHLEVVFMSSRNFQPLGVRLMWQNVVSALGNLLPVVAGIGGFVASRCIFTLSRFLTRARGVPIEATGRGTLAEAKDLAFTGAPLLIAGVLYGYLGVADRSVIACFMGPEAVGQYSLTALVVAATQLVPFCIATLFYPRLAECYGKTGSPHALRRYFWILLWLNIAAVLPVCVGAYLLIGPLTESYLPKYVAGIPAAKIGCLSSLAFIYIGVGGIIAVIRRNTPYVVAIGVSLVLVWLLGGYCVTHGYGIVGAVWARALSTILLCVFTIIFAFRLTSRDAASAQQ